MARRQNDYLNSLLAEPPPRDPDLPPLAPSPPPPAVEPPAPLRGTTLLGRESALARIATGEVKQVTQLLLDPGRVRIWKGNARHQASLNEDSCRDLIDAILAEGGQKVPGVVRRVTDDPAYDYEVIAGTRRHWAISWLRAHDYPDMQFLAQVHALDDESAFRFADIENRARKDVSDFERARNYKAALGTYYEGRHNRMAERLRLSKGWLSKMLAVAGLPDWAVNAFASPADIQLKTCYPLAQKILAVSARDGGDIATEKAMVQAAKKLAREQEDRRRSGRPPVGPQEVVQTLLQASRPSGGEAFLFVGDSAHGRPALSVLSSNRNGVTLRLHAGSGASEAELVQLLKKALNVLEENGRGLRP